MVRLPLPAAQPPACSPHPRGDGPVAVRTVQAGLVFSPPAWGWSGFWTRRLKPCWVLPTRVGMVRSRAGSWWLLKFSPPAWGWSVRPTPRSLEPSVLPTRVGMVRGEGSFQEGTLFSPPAWGWSGIGHFPANAANVLPTRVGMVRSRVHERDSRARSPHPRGDGPDQLVAVRDDGMFSPPAWGWSGRER